MSIENIKTIIITIIIITIKRRRKGKTI